MFIVSKNIDEINSLKAQMDRNFDMKDVGSTKESWVLRYTKTEKMVRINFSQEKYVEKILVRFEINKENPVNVPLASHFKLSSSLCLISVEERILCLLYDIPIQ